MKAAFSAIWITLSLLTGFQQALIFVHFKLNQDAISREFCVNKNRPELECNGTCYLKKLLEKAGEDPQPVSIMIHPWIDTFPSLTAEPEEESQTIEIQSKTSAYKEIQYKEPCLETLVPPPVTLPNYIKESEILIQ